MIEQESIQHLKDSLDIVEVIGNYIELKKSGANYKANCPFHGEKTPSFVVSPSKQIFHCFGCGKGGDAISFVMEQERLSYPEAIEKIAASYNFTLRYTQGTNGYQELKSLLESMQNWYQRELQHSAQAQQYLQGRAISPEMIRVFGIGFVGDGAQVLSHINALHIPQPKAIEAGVLAQGDSGRVYARLTQRITFPIHSPTGAIVGFGGRTIGDHPAKYINSPQTKLFNKSSLLYGYHLAKERIYKTKQIIITEGYLDVVMLHQAGFKQAVATLGTALTQQHLPLLKKSDAKILLAYDGDNAGKEAAYKAALMLSQHGFEGGVVLFGQGVDPADMVASGRADELQQLFSKSTPLISFVIAHISQGYNLQNPQEQQRAFDEVKRYLDTLAPIVRDGYVAEAATLLGVRHEYFGAAAPKQHSLPPRAPQGTRGSEDIELLSILRSMATNESYIDVVLNACDSAIFARYSSIYEALLRKESEHPELIRLELDEQLVLLGYEDFVRALCNKLIHYYTQKLKQLVYIKELTSDQKLFIARKLKSDIIPRLKKGELVSLDIRIP